jgi:hypothetical protein
MRASPGGIRRWLTARLRLAWWVLRHDSTAFTEALSGLALIGLRGLLLLGVRPADPPYDVVRLLRDAGITEERWAVYLMLCGALQILFAGSRHALIRLWLKVAIVGAFAVVTVAYELTGEGARPVVLSLVCLIAFYFGLMIRVFKDRRRGILSLEERHATHGR